MPICGFIDALAPYWPLLQELSKKEGNVRVGIGELRAKNVSVRR